MHVTCPNCGARYAVDPAAIGPAGRAVQCARCHHQWRERPIDTAPQPPRSYPTDFAVPLPRPHISSLAAVEASTPRAHRGRWLAIAVVLVLGAGIGTYMWRAEIASHLPGEWRGIVDIARDVLRQ